MVVQTRRRLLTGLALAGAGLVRAPQVLAGEGGLETTTVRLAVPVHSHRHRDTEAGEFWLSTLRAATPVPQGARR